MEQKPETQQNETVPQPEQAVASNSHLEHSYTDDLAKAMQATDAASVQELLTLAHEKEEAAARDVREEKTNWMFIVGAVICFLISGAVGWFVWSTHEKTKPVPLTSIYQPIVFPQIAPIDTTGTDIREVVANAKTNSALTLNKPTIIPLISGTSTEPLTPSQFFTFTEGALPASLLAKVSGVRLGVVADGTTVTPFLLFTTTDSVGLAKEFQATEPTLIYNTYRALGIDLTTNLSVATAPFNSEYVSNLPVRMIRNSDNSVAALYGFASDSVLVLTTNIPTFQAVSAAAITH